ncbi:MAG: SMI1/KNR4 family protein [Myxococcota bacterium]
MSVRAALDFWNSHQVELRPRASSAQLATLERLLGCPLSSDVREFYAAANGMAADTCDQHMMRFWSIGEIIDEFGQDDPGIANGVPFCDGMAWAWVFRFQRHPGGVAVYSDFHELSWFSLTDFLSEVSCCASSEAALEPTHRLRALIGGLVWRLTGRCS